MEADEQGLHPGDGTGSCRRPAVRPEWPGQDGGHVGVIPVRPPALTADMPTLPIAMHELLAAGLLLLAVLGVAVAAAGIVACLRLGSVAETLIALYLVAWAEVIMIMLALSTVRSVTRGATVACVAAGVGVSALVWHTRGRPQLQPIRPALTMLRPTLTDPLVRVAGAGFGLVWAYSAVLAVLTPVNDGDSLTYHLARAALWAQDHKLGFVDNPTDGRLGPNPPNAEIGQLFSLVIGGTDRFVALTQLLALPMTVIAVYATARRVGAPRENALFGAMLFGLLPVVVLQSSTGLNDLVAASFVAAAAPFALAPDRRFHLIAGLAAALAVGSKSAVPLLLAPLVIVVFATHPFRRAVGTVVLLAGGAVAGSYWSLENLHATGKLDGGLSEGQIADHAPGAVLATIGQLARRSLDLPGTDRGQVGYYAIIGAAFLIAAGVAALRDRPKLMTVAIRAALVVAVVPTAIALAARATGRERSGMLADPAGSWYGPVGVLAVVTTTVILASRYRAGRAPLRDVLLATAPLTQIVLMGAALAYDPYRGRFLISAMALSAATWGVLLSRRPLATGVVTIALVTITLSLQTFAGKPAGFPPGSPAAEGAPWGEPRWFVQTALRPDGNERAVLRFVDRHVPARTTIALAVRPNDFLSPYFGRGLTRKIRLVPDGVPVPEDADWLVIASERTVDLCLTDWRQAFARRSGWRVLRRIATGTC